MFLLVRMIFMAEKQIIYQGQDLVVVYQPADVDVLMVCFNWVGFRYSGERFDADQLMEKIGYAAVGVASLSDHWYISPEMGEAIAAIRKVASKYKRLAGYGFSMGGYAVIKYSAALGLDTVVSFSPQWSIDPDQAPWDQRYKAHYQPAMTGMGIRSEDRQGHTFIVYDPLYEPDRLHAEKIIASGKVHQILVRHGEHDSIKMLANTAVMKSVFSSCLEYFEAGVRRAVRSGLKKSRLFRSHVFAARGLRRLGAGDLRAAKKWLELARSAEEKSPVAWRLSVRLREVSDVDHGH